MWSLLLNPRVWIALAVIALAGWVCFHIDSLEDRLAEKDGIIAALTARVEMLRSAAEARQIALEGCAGNLEAIRAANEEMRQVIARSAVYRGKYDRATAVENQRPAPGKDEPCINGGRIDEGHRSALNLAVAEYNVRVRGKVHRPDGDGAGRGPAEVLPAAAAGR